MPEAVAAEAAARGAVETVPTVAGTRIVVAVLVALVAVVAVDAVPAVTPVCANAVPVPAGKPFVSIVGAAFGDPRVGKPFGPIVVGTV